MASKTLLTDYARLYNVENMYYAPVATVAPLYQNPDSIYCFLADVDPWPNDLDPPSPQQDQKSIKQILKRIFVAKKITSNDITPVIKRINWNSGVIYNYYRDDVNMLEIDQNGSPVYSFYVRNRYDQVFKCLWNANGGPSTVEPYFEPGSYGTNNIFTGTDGYKWKYMYTIDGSLKIKFMDESWLPVPIGVGYVPNPLINPDNMTVAPGIGNIDVVNVTNGGSGYDPANDTISIVITGDGTGASATPVIDYGIVTDVIMANTGSNYSYANASISSTMGAGAEFVVPVSPIGGHGLDPISELGCSHVMLCCEFNGSESGNIPTDITYHQVGILVNPVDKSSSPENANGTIYKTSTDIVVATGFGDFASAEYIYQGTSLSTATFYAEVLSFDSSNNIIKTINTQGSLKVNASVFGNSSSTVRTVLSYSTPVLVSLSGYPIFLENRSGIQRSSDGIEQVKIVLGY